MLRRVADEPRKQNAKNLKVRRNPGDSSVPSADLASHSIVFSCLEGNKRRNLNQSCNPLPGFLEFIPGPCSKF